MMTLSRHNQKQPCRSNGFSLVEIMVAMVIGLLGMIITMQVYTLFEGQKRSTTGGADAMNNGAIALYGLQGDIEQSGYGISALNLMGCDVLLRAGVTLSAIAPVTINSAAIPAGDANTDTLLVVYGNSNGSPEGDTITSQGSTNSYAVATPTGFAANDLVVAEPQNRPNACSLNLDRVTSVASPNVNVATGVTGMTNGTLYNMGQAPKVQAYAIRNGNLTVCDYMVNNCGSAANTNNPAIWVPIANNIVSMRAQYGRDTSATMDGIVDGYDQTVASTTTVPAVSSNQCGWARVSAISLALVARNGQPEKTAVTTNEPTWAGGETNTAGTPAILSGTPINLTATTVPAGFTWQNYRYKVFQTTVPIRNISWKGAQAGC